LRRFPGAGAEPVAREREGHGPWFLADFRLLGAHGGLREHRDELGLD
jgi:hypothetical protein